MPPDEDDEYRRIMGEEPAPVEDEYTRLMRGETRTTTQAARESVFGPTEDLSRVPISVEEKEVVLRRSMPPADVFFLIDDVSDPTAKAKSTERLFRERFPSANSRKDLRGVTDSLDVAEAQRMLLRRAGDRWNPTNIDNAFRSAASAREYLKNVAESERQMGEGLYLANLGRALTVGATAGFADPAKMDALHPKGFTKEEAQRGLATNAEQQGFGGQAGLAVANLAGAMIPMSSLARGIAAGAQRFGMAQQAANTLGSTASMGIYSAVATEGTAGEKAAAAAQGAAFGYLAPTTAAYVRSALKALPPRVQNAAAEAIGFALAGQAVHGVDPTQAGIDGTIGAVLGAFGVKTPFSSEAMKPTPERVRAAEGAMRQGRDPVAEINALRLGRDDPFVEKAPAPPPGQYRRDEEEAGEIKAAAVEAGVARPEEVYSPERVKVVEDAIARGEDPHAALAATPPERRPDGSIAAPFKPTEQALAEGIIEPGAVPAVEKAQAEGVRTVSSGVRDGVGFAIGADAQGKPVRVEADPRAASEATGVEAAVKALRQEKPRRVVTADDLPDATTARGATWYHGTRTEGLSPERLDTIGSSDPRGLVGMGQYLTDDVSVARGYAEGRKGRGGKPTIYEASVEPRAVINFEKPLPKDVADAILRTAESFDDPAIGASLVSDSVRAAIAKGKTGMEVYREFTDALAYEQIPVSEAAEPLQTLQGRLRDLGYDAITHVGGQRVGGGNLHRVLVMLDPTDAGRAQPSDPRPNPVRSFAPMAEPGATPRLGVGLGGATRATAQGAADLIGLPSKALHKGLAAADTAIGKVVERVRAGIERLTGEPLRGTLGRGRGLGHFTGIDRREAIARFQAGKRASQVRAGFAARDLALGETGQRLTKEQGDVVMRYFEGGAEVADVATAVGPKYAKMAEKYARARDRNEAEALELGGISQETFDKFTTGPVRYLTRRYEVVEQGKADTGPGIGSRSGVNPGRTYRRKDLSPEQRAALGEIRDPAVAMAHTLARQDALLGALRFMRDASLDPTAASTERPTGRGWTDAPLPNDRQRYGLLAGKYVKKSVKDEVDGMVGGRPGGVLEVVGDVYDGLYSSWKYASTALNPATHVRNIAGNAIFKELDHYSWGDPGNLKHTLEAINVIRATEAGPMRDFRLKAIEERLLHADFVSTEVLDLANEVAKTAGVSWKEKVQNYLADKAEHAKAARVVQAIPGTELAGRLYAMEDTVTKIGSWIKKIREGQTPEAAAQAVRDAYPVFGEGVLPDIYRRHKNVGRFVLPPFLSFSEQAARIFGRAAVTKPVTTAVVVGALLEGLNALNEAAGLTDEDSEAMKDELPPWLRPGLTRPIVDGDAKGIFNILDLSTTLPLGNEIENTRSLIKGEERANTPLGMTPPPLVTAVIDFVTGKSLRSGRDTAPPNAFEYEKEAAKEKGLGEALIPSVPYVPGSRSFNRIEDADRAVEAARKAKAAPAEIQRLEEEAASVRLSKWAGVTLKDIDRPEARKRAEARLMYERKEKLKRLQYLEERKGLERGSEDARKAEAELAEIEAALDRLGAGRGLGRKGR